MTEINKADHDEFIEVIEDTVEYWCDQMMKNGAPVSGETAWAIVECYSIAKQAEMQGLVTSRVGND